MLGTPVFIRNDPRFNIFNLKTGLDFSLARMASSNFDLHIDRVSSVPTHSVYELAKRPSWVIVKGNMPR